MRRKSRIAVGLIILLVAGFFGYTLWSEHYARKSLQVIVVKDISTVEPGLGLRVLHEKGYAGKGINVAIIDGLLLETHEEFADSLVHLEIVGSVMEEDHYHGTTVASILTGKLCGVVPQARLHFFATNFAEESNVLVALERLLAYNETLEAEEKIRFVNISTGLRQEQDAFQSLVEKAWDQGIIVFTSTMPTMTDPPFALREAAYVDKANMNQLDNIVIGDWMNEFLKQNNMTREELVRIRETNDLENGYVSLYLPCSGRYVASHVESNGYVLDNEGGLSWGTPFLTGLAALASSVNPSLTNEQVLSLLQRSIIRNDKGLDIIDPQILVSLGGSSS